MADIEQIQDLRQMALFGIQSFFNYLARIMVSGAKVRARRCSMRSQSERGARNSAIFCHQTAERYGPASNPPGVLPLLPNNGSKAHGEPRSSLRRSAVSGRFCAALIT